jgi:hypothetical protein
MFKKCPNNLSAHGGGACSAGTPNAPANKDDPAACRIHVREQQQRHSPQTACSTTAGERKGKYLDFEQDQESNSGIGGGGGVLGGLPGPVAK